MSPALKIAVACGFPVVLLLVGLADFTATRNQMVVPDAVAGTETEVPAEGQRPQDGPDVMATLQAAGLIVTRTEEDSVLREIIPADRVVNTHVLLLGDDRVGFLAWTQSPDVKTYFSALKEALQASFSADVSDLIDKTDEPEGRPTRNILAFLDPAIHEERMIFIRVRQRLFEFHVAPGKEDQVNALIEALTQ